MAVIRWNPWNIANFFDEEGWDMPTIPGLSRLGQGLNLYETKDAFVAEAALPGVSSDRIDVTVEDGLVRITGGQEQKKEQQDAARYLMNELSYAYNYAFRLPKNVDQNTEPSASFDNGMVQLTFQKIQKAEPKRIAIKAKEKNGKEEK